MTKGPCIIGLTGSFGSGCTTVAEILEKKGDFQRYSLSKILRNEYSKFDTKPIKDRETLQNFGDQLRIEKGADILAKLLISEIRNELPSKLVVDSIRNPEEVHFLRSQTDNFYLFAVNADKELRWNRCQKQYGGHKNEFERDDDRDSGHSNVASGQKVQNCFLEADVVLTNDEVFEVKGNRIYEDLASKVLRYLDLVAKPLNGAPPRPTETFMASAYASAQRSSCIKRKVGAVIVDSKGSIISSGFNEVPEGEDPCKNKWSCCFRDYSRKKFIDSLMSEIPNLESYIEKLESKFKENFRILDICRALHAEENAILNLARNRGAVSLAECTLYTTTYPCRLCANKIASINIGKIVYVEPYPDQEAKRILHDVGQEFFEGITHRAYFRVYGVEEK